MKQDVIHQQCSAFGHASSSTAGTEAAAFATTGDQVFRMAGVAAHPQETVLETAAFEVILEFPLDALWQYHTLGRQMYLERRVVSLDKLIEKGSFGAMAHVYKRANARTGIPASRQRHHDRILASSSCASD
jgi:hypothetical protein